jgi:hypothetical protein
MGIVCYCPNGHRVKVKDRFAGLTGLCPHCGAKFRIGAAATDGAGGPHVPDLPLARFVPLDPAMVATLPRALPYGTAARAAAEAAAAAEVHDMFEPPADTPAVEPAPQPLHQTIAERPDLTWCIAYPGGAPSEPVDAETMQAWLGGGEAEGTELVWRADWADWRPVQEVFSEFFPAG